HLIWAAAPRSVPFAELARQVAAALPEGVEHDEERLTHGLLQGVFSSLLECHLFEPEFVTEVSMKPVASPLARVLAQNFDKVTNRRHRMFEVQGLPRQLISAMDGSRDRDALIELLETRVNSGMPLLDEQNQPVREPDQVRQALTRGVDGVLRRLAKSALL